MVRAILLLLLAIAAAVALASCAGSIEVPKEVKVEIPIACVKPQDVPQKPPIRTQGDLLAMDRYRRTLAAWSDKVKLEIYAAELEAIVTGCSRIPP